MKVIAESNIDEVQNGQVPKLSLKPFVLATAGDEIDLGTVNELMRVGSDSNICWNLKNTIFNDNNVVIVDH